MPRLRSSCKETNKILNFRKIWLTNRPPLWFSGQSSSLQIQGSWVRFAALPHFLRTNGYGTWPNQPREDN
jgi:hypothetical protein